MRHVLLAIGALLKVTFFIVAALTAAALAVAGWGIAYGYSFDGHSMGHF